MRVNDFMEKRKFKRFALSLPVKVRLVTKEKKEDIMEIVTSNVSYNGVYIRDIDLTSIKLNDNLHITLSVPRDETRDFPFSRITGKARVVRAEKETCAFEFSEEMSRLCIAS